MVRAEGLTGRGLAWERLLGKGPPLVRAEGLVTGGLPGKRLLGKGPPLGRAEGVTGRGLRGGGFRVLTFLGRINVR